MPFSSKSRAAPLSDKRLLTLWNALPGVEKRSKVGEQKRSSLHSPVERAGFEPSVIQSNRSFGDNPNRPPGRFFSSEKCDSVGK